jgi:hypothetical protein
MPTITKEQLDHLEDFHERTSQYIYEPDAQELGLIIRAIKSND